jgi:C-terminal processing protease CtpA/Prc
VTCSAEKLSERKNGVDPPADEVRQMSEQMRLLNAAFVKVERLPGNVGYIRVDGFLEPGIGCEPLLAAMTFVKHTDALLVDLRYNPGGTPPMIRDFCSYFFSGDKPVHLNSIYFRKGDRTVESWTTKEVPGPRYLDKPIYVLTSAGTFSGAEECAYNLQAQKRATVVGEATRGGAHPSDGDVVVDHFLVSIPTGRAINPVTKSNWEGAGVQPDVACDADKALDTARELAVKTLLASRAEHVRERIKADLERDARTKARIEERRQETLKSRAAGKQ